MPHRMVRMDKTRKEKTEGKTKMKKCKRCGFQAATDKEESTIEEHHLIPKSIGGTDNDGRRGLCKTKCHQPLDGILMKIIFDKFVPQSDKESCKQYIKQWTLKNYIKE